MAGIIGIFWLIIVISFISAFAKGKKATRKSWPPRQEMPERPEAPVRDSAATKSRAATSAQNVGPELCDNKEPHRHFSSAPPKETYTAPTVSAPDQIERRLGNMKDLYDAGLLTRAEYDDEVRRVRQG